MIKNIKIKNQETIQKIAPLLLALVILFTYTRLFIIPTFKSWRDLKHKVVKLKQDVKFAKTSIDNLESIKTQLHSLKKQVGSYENRLPREKEIPTILEDLSNMALQSGVELTAIEPAKGSPSPTSKDCTEVPITLVAKCGYHQLATFISKLESSSRFMKVSNIKLSRNHSDVYHHNIDLKISTFVLTEENKLTSAGN